MRCARRASAAVTGGPMPPRRVGRRGICVSFERRQNRRSTRAQFLRPAAAVAALTLPRYPFSMRNATPFAAGRPLDVVCLGRFAVDFYAQQIGARLEDVTSFAKYLGGSSANTAFGCARLGLKAGLISRDRRRRARATSCVETIAREGCDTSHVGVDPAPAHRRRRARHQGQGHVPADLPARELRGHGDRPRRTSRSATSRSSRALLITGTHFSTEHVDRISQLRARARAPQRRAHGARHRLPAGAVGPDQARRRRDPLRPLRHASPRTCSGSCRSSTS